MAPRILFLDDNKYRHKTVKPHLLHDEAYTVEQAVELLKTKKYDIIFLDHDLGGEEMVSSDREDTGMTVAKFMVEEEILTELVVVHSCNPAGAANMTALLRQDGYEVMQIPFTALVPQIASILERIE